MEPTTSHKPLGSSAWHLSSRSGEASHKLLYTVYLRTKVSRTVIPTKKKKNVDRGVFIDPFSLRAAAELLIQTTESCSAAGRFVLRSARGRYSSRAVTPSSGTLRCSSYWRETCPPCRAHVSVAPADCWSPWPAGSNAARSAACYTSHTVITNRRPNCQFQTNC